MPAALVLSSCANFNSIYREFAIDSGDKPTKSITMDVKQRAVLSGSRDGNTVVCAEPSPDALAVYAAGLSASAYAGEKKALDMALSGSETASFIGNRTETIQLLRDNLYRACEGYLSGALDKQAYISLIRRYQVMTMGLLAIERLTDTVRPPHVTLVSGTASASTGASAEDKEKASEKKAKAEVALANSTTRSADLKTKLDEAVKAADEKSDDANAKAALKKADEEYKKALAEKSLNEALLRNATQEYEESKGRQGHNATAGGARVEYSPEAAKSQAQSASAVAAAAQAIVKMTIDDGFKLEDCFARKDKCSEADQVKALDTVAMACKPLASAPSNYKLCAEPILRLAAVPLGKIGDLVRRHSDTVKEEEQETPDFTSPTSDLTTVLKNVVGVKENQLYRVDVFATPSQIDLQGRIVDAIIANDSIGLPRKREISLNECTSRFSVDSSADATIRYDDEIDEEKKRDQLAKLLKGTSLNLTKVTEKAVVRSTPLYISIFLCK